MKFAELFKNLSNNTVSTQQWQLVVLVTLEIIKNNFGKYLSIISYGSKNNGTKAYCG